MLNYCSKCKEKSSTRKVYTGRDGKKKVVEYCVNKSCGEKITWEVK